MTIKNIFFSEESKKICVTELYMNTNHNLNINEYSFKELLSLFDLQYDFSINDLKECKKKVLFMHPDKSSKPPEYFLFYKQAFQLIVQYYEEKYRQTQEVPKTEIKYVPSKTSEENNPMQTAIKAMKHETFNKTFNELFDKNMAVKPDETRNQWFKNEDAQFKVNETVTSQNLGKVIESIKSQNNDVVRYKGVENMYSSAGTGTSFLYDEMEDKDSYVSCDLFSKLKFDDLRKVHKDQTVLSVAESDFSKVKIFKSVEELNRERGMQDTKPFEKMAAEGIIRKQQEEYEQLILKKQHEDKLKSMEYEKKDKDIQAYFLRLHQ